MREATSDPDYPFQQDTYVLKRRLWSLLGARASVFDGRGNLLFACKRKALRLREDIRIYGDEEMRREVLLLRARSVIDFGATYDVTDARTGQSVGALRRHGMRSLLRDEWSVLGQGDARRGTIREDGNVLSILRRVSEVMSLLAPQSYAIECDGHAVGSIRQNRNPFTLHYDIDLSGDPERRFDRRLAVAAAVLLLNVEGRQG